MECPSQSPSGRGNSGLLNLADDLVLSLSKVLQLLIEVARQQQYGVFQLVLVGFQRPLAKAADRDRGCECDGRYQQDAADDQPAYRTSDRGTASVEINSIRGVSAQANRSGRRSFCRHCTIPPHRYDSMS